MSELTKEPADNRVDRRAFDSAFADWLAARADMMRYEIHSVDDTEEFDALVEREAVAARQIMGLEAPSQEALKSKLEVIEYYFREGSAADAAIIASVKADIFRLCGGRRNHP